MIATCIVNKNTSGGEHSSVGPNERLSVDHSGHFSRVQPSVVVKLVVEKSLVVLELVSWEEKMTPRRASVMHTRSWILSNRHATASVVAIESHKGCPRSVLHPLRSPRVNPTS